MSQDQLLEEKLELEKLVSTLLTNLSSVLYNIYSEIHSLHLKKPISKKLIHYIEYCLNAFLKNNSSEIKNIYDEFPYHDSMMLHSSIYEFLHTKKLVFDIVSMLRMETNTTEPLDYSRFNIILIDSMAKVIIYKYACEI